MVDQMVGDAADRLVRGVDAIVGGEGVPSQAVQVAARARTWSTMSATIPARSRPSVSGAEPGAVPEVEPVVVVMVRR
ncbi:hypothetical protein ACFYWN_33045 [Streptomyces sp. NPDC002917]|uniref:hypothetical protein n=1 Tax=Streptomyces sp. NPDC002917 TaxID=3364671 RepID=UPI003673C697